MKLRIALDEKLMDVRVRDRLIAEGKITKKEVDEFLATLPDDSARAHNVPKQEDHATE